MKLFGSYKESKFTKPQAGGDPAPGKFSRDAAPRPVETPVRPRPEPVAEPIRPRPEPAPVQQRTDPAQIRPRQDASRPVSKRSRASKRRRRKKRLVRLAVICGVLLFLYLFLCWFPWGQLAGGSVFDRFQGFMIRNSRESHSFLWVQYFFPSYVRQPYIDAEIKAREEQLAHNSGLNPEDIVVTEPINGEIIIRESIDGDIVKNMTAEQLAFYERFYQLDVESAEAYFAAHPNAIANGYDKIYVNEAGLDDSGTDILTTSGEQVLAIDAENEILLIRVTGATYRGVLAIAKDPNQLHCYVSAGISTVEGNPGYGQSAGKIAQAHNGVLAISASGFDDVDGVGTGGGIVGFCRSDGKDYGKHRYYGSKRLELHEDNWLYITDAYKDCSSKATNAMEFEPALIVDGKKLESYVYTADNPRACVGQTDKGEILMLAIEGRQISSAGCSVGECSNILMRYRCITAMNMDGGTSAMLWYDGEPVIRCNNLSLPQGRSLPNAWVYVRKDG